MMAMAAPPPVPPPPPAEVAPAHPDQPDMASGGGEVDGFPQSDDDIQLIIWTPGVVRCGGSFVEPVRVETPQPGLAMPTIYGGPSLQPIAFTFRIDAHGRPLSIAREGNAGSNIADTMAALDLEPALAASMFKAGPTRQQCRISYSAVPVRLTAATPHQLIPLMYGPAASMLSEPVYRRLAGTESNCSIKTPLPRVVYFPPMDTLPFTPGHYASYALRYDIDANGMATNIALLTNNGDPALAVEGERALRQSRWAPNPAKGCLSTMGQPPQANLEAPPAPPAEAFRLKGASCPEAATSVLHVSDVPFPPQFQRRSIVGWAIVRFDIAPWGEVGNVETVVAEPAAGFGDQAKRVVMAAKADKSTAGYSGCTVRVRFDLNGEGRAGTFIPAATSHKR